MSNILELNSLDIELVAGGNPGPGQSWVDYLQDKYPGGEWRGNSFFPNGAPDGA